jgi:putative nucleotidyltransferase with HDIG domain
VNRARLSEHASARALSAGVGHLYVALIVVLGAAAIVDCTMRMVHRPAPATWLVLAALTWIGGSFALKVPQVPASISVSETFVFMIVLLFGGPPATLTVAVDGLLTSVLREDRQLRRLLFNVAEPALSTWVAWHAFDWASALAPLGGAPHTLSALVLPMLVMTSVYFLLNSSLTALAVATDTGTSPLQIWRTHFVGVSLSYFAGASVALLVVLNTREVSWGAFGAVLPLVLLLYATFRGRIRRTEDANRHLAELNRMHLSTLESLAMAIDAKDHVTHGHIRRVQTQTVALGRQLGLCGERELKALEAAALLHDMGKLAVPDYILHKPGALTPSEYERVKNHAVVGAEILAAVDFPYPVVPIVRHHHENWDGSGYPDGLAGDDIPIGARILAVVDCYDALTSDRPYRRALAPRQALAMIESRRGVLYDPIVVDAFVAMQPSLMAVDPDAAAASPALDEIARSSDATAHVPAAPDALPGTEVATAVVELWWLLSAQADRVTTVDLIELIARRLRRLTPASLVVVYRPDHEAQALTVAHASGAGERQLDDLRVSYGRGTAGWVAAHQVPVVNGDPGLDVGARFDELAPRLDSSLVVPVVSGRVVVGVLACYAADARRFTDPHRKLAEAVAAAMAPALERAWGVGSPVAAADAVDGLQAYGGSGAPACAVLVVSPPRGGLTSDAVAHVEAAACRVVRHADLVVRGPEGRTLVLLARVDAESGREIAERLQSELERSHSPEPKTDATTLPAPVAVGVAVAPHDGVTLDTLMAVAEARARVGSRPVLESAPEPAMIGREGWIWA